MDEKACPAPGKQLNIALTGSGSQTTLNDRADFSRARQYRITITTGGGEGHGHSSGSRNAVVTKAATAAFKAA